MVNNYHDNVSIEAATCLTPTWPTCLKKFFSGYEWFSFCSSVHQFLKFQLIPHALKAFKFHKVLILVLFHRHDNFVTFILDQSWDFSLYSLGCTWFWFLFGNLLLLFGNWVFYVIVSGNRMLKQGLKDPFGELKDPKGLLYPILMVMPNNGYV